MDFILRFQILFNKYLFDRFYFFVEFESLIAHIEKVDIE